MLNNNLQQQQCLKETVLHKIIKYKEGITHHGERKDSLINDVGRFIQFYGKK